MIIATNLRHWTSDRSRSVVNEPYTENTRLRASAMARICRERGGERKKKAVLPWIPLGDRLIHAAIRLRRQKMTGQIPCNRDASPIVLLLRTQPTINCDDRAIRGNYKVGTRVVGAVSASLRPLLASRP